MTLTDRREHSGGAIPTTLAGNVLASATTISITDGTGWPTGAIGDFVVTVERGTDREERVLCESRSGPVLTVAAGGRGWDGTVARAHQSGVPVEHTWSTTEADEASAHLSSTSAHGVDEVVGTTETQTLSDKTLIEPVIDAPDITGGSIDGSVAMGSATVTGNPTFSGAPAIGNFSGMAHDHGDADDGGNLPISSITGLQTALDAKVDDSQVGAASGVATLDGSVLLPTAQLPSIPFAKLPVGTGSSQVAQGDHTHTVDAPTYDLTIAQFTLTDLDPARTMAEVDLGVGTWLILATCAGCTLNASGTATRWQYDLTSTGGTATFIGAAPVAAQSEGTGLQGGGTVWGLLTVTVGPVNVAFTIEKLGTGAQVTNSTLGALLALPLHGI